MTEKTIAKFKYENNTYKLLKVVESFTTAGVETTKTVYLIVKNRKRIKRTVWEHIAKKNFLNIITTDILQKDLFKPTIKLIGQIVILDYSKVYGWHLKLQLTEEEAKEIILSQNLVKDENSKYLDTWLTKERHESLKKIQL